MYRQNTRLLIKDYSILIPNISLIKRALLLIIFGVSTSGFCQKLNFESSISKSNFNRENILRHLFDGIYESEKQCISWKPKPEEITLTSDNDSSYTYLDSIYKYTSSTDVYCVVVLNTIQYIEGIGQTCHGCSPSELGLALYKEENEKWKLLKLQSGVNQIGYSGILPPASIIELGKDKFGIHFKEEDHQVNIESNLGYVYSVDSISFSKNVLTYKQNDVIEYYDQPLIEEGSINIIKTENDYFDIQLVLETRRYMDKGFKMIKTKSITYKCFDSNWYFASEQNKW